MKRSFFLLCWMSFSVFSSLMAQETFPYNGISDYRDRTFAFTNAIIYKAYDTKVENATLVIKKGKVEAAGVGIKIPADAVIIDATGKTIYPAFIDIFSDYGMPAPQAEGKRPDSQPQMLSNKEGAFAWNEALKTEFRASENFSVNKENARELATLGFGTVLAHRQDGISRGSAVLVALGDEREHEMILKTDAAHVLSFSKGTSTQNYPSSLMGAIALIRQTCLDGQWYKTEGHKEETNLSLEAWNRLQTLPQVFEARGKLDVFRADKIAGEFGVEYILKGTGEEYQRLEEVKSTNARFIIPLDFPEPFDAENPYEAARIPFKDLKHWETAPSNPAMLEKAGIDFALTTADLKKKQDFWKQLREAIEYGLSEKGALKALTHSPAAFIEAGDMVGSLEAGKVASFFVTNGNVFEKETTILQSWIKGKPYILEEIDLPDLRGTYDLTVGSASYRMRVKGSLEAPECSLEKTDTTTIKVNLGYSHHRVDLSFQPDKDNPGRVRLSGVAEGGKWYGRGQQSDGFWVSWQSIKTGGFIDSTMVKKDTTGEKPGTGELIYPFNAYGWQKKPEQKSVLFKNATVWTNEEQGILENGDVLIQNGKIAAVGKNLAAPAGAETVDATGKHLTCGIIDEHSHIAISRGVNEGTQASSAEVRIGDVIDSEDINIYRQLSGGVTTSQLLHGSANPIGGQSAIIKLRWGYSPEEMKFEAAPPFIKFALGENVKQSNWGDNNKSRFPQTRMGVEQVFVDYFTRAREYGDLMASGKTYRRDLELEALLEILQRKRFITCHSYRQSEINMLMRVAEEFGFRVNTFTHILEGYKVADKMAEHGAGGSTFSDWWAYKFEVYDAIPYNGAIMHQQGVTVAFNSDDAEMARRLNQEAAKAVKYGRVSEEDAWKFVTLNPARLLHIDDRVGSIRKGKDADVVIWSDNPLSIKAVAERTFVDGREFFNRMEEQQKKEWMETERNRIITKMLDDKKKGKKTQPARAEKQILYHCDDIEDEHRH